MNEIMRARLDAENLYEDIMDSDTHLVEEHVGISDRDLIRRLVSMAKIVPVFTVSTFENPQSAKKHIMKAITANKHEIAAWLGDKRSSTKLAVMFKTGKHGPAGHGIRNTGYGLRSFETRLTCVILKKNKYAKRGFSLVTAFPDLDSRTTEPYPMDFAYLLSSVGFWQTELPIVRFYMRCLLNESTGNVQISCPLTHEIKMEFTQRLDETHLAVISYHPNERRAFFHYYSYVPSDGNDFKNDRRAQCPPELVHRPTRPVSERYWDIWDDPDKDVLENAYQELFYVAKEKINEFERTDDTMATMNDVIRRGEMYYIYKEPYSHAYGNEQEPGRPAIIVSNDMNNQYSRVVEIVFLTTQEKKPLPTHVAITTAKRDSIALCEAVYSVDKGRLGSRVGTVPEDTMRKIDEALCISLGINVDVNGSLALKTWCEAYDKRGSDIQVPKQEPKTEQGTEKTIPAETKAKPVDVKLTPEYIKVKAERDVYKQLYQELLAKK